MRLMWPQGLGLRAFYDPLFHRLSLVSNVIDDDAEGRTFAERLAISFSRSGEFRDLEFTAGSVAVGPFAKPNQWTTQDSVGAWVPDIREPRLTLSSDGAALVQLTSSAVYRWVHVVDTPVFVGLTADEALAAIYVESFTEDPEGTHEAAWLDTFDC